MATIDTTRLYAPDALRHLRAGDKVRLKTTGRVHEFRRFTSQGREVAYRTIYESGETEEWERRTPVTNIELVESNMTWTSVLVRSPNYYRRVVVRVAFVTGEVSHAFARLENDPADGGERWIMETPPKEAMPQNVKGRITHWMALAEPAPASMRGQQGDGRV